MIQLDTSEDDMQALKRERGYHEDPQVRRRIMVVYLKGMAYSHQEIGEIADVTQKTVREHLRLYEEGGLAALSRIK